MDMHKILSSLLSIQQMSLIAEMKYVKAAQPLFPAAICPKNNLLALPAEACRRRRSEVQSRILPRNFKNEKSSGIAKTLKSHYGVLSANDFINRPMSCLLLGAQFIVRQVIVGPRSDAPPQAAGAGEKPRFFPGDPGAENRKKIK